MSAMTGYNRTTTTSSSNSRGACFAVADGRSTGIFFSLAEALVQIKGFPGAKISNFPSVQQAREFLEAHGLSPLDSGGWLSTRKDRPPLLYSKRAYGSKKGDSFVVVESSAVTTTPTTPWPNPSSQQLSSSTMTSPFFHGRHHLPSSLGREEPQQVRPIVSRDTSPQEGASVPSSSPDGRQGQKHTREHVDTRNLLTESKKAKVCEIINSDGDCDQRGEAPAPKQLEDNSNPTQSSMDDRAAVPEVSFDSIQRRAIDAALEGKNVFLTGVAGTGKSLVTQTIVHNAKTVLRREVACAAPTGVAAVNLGPELGAQTVHSLAGVGVPQSARDFANLLSPWTAKKWRAIEVLVLDEIGMLQADFLDWLDVFVRKARNRPLEPFGGIQLIFVGDFAQLGPIPGRTSLKNEALKPKDDGADCLLGISVRAPPPEMGIAVAVTVSFCRRSMPLEGGNNSPLTEDGMPICM
jgi:DNA replication protein DnaC